MDIIQVLRSTQLFSSISDKNLASLADICLTKRIRKKELLFLEGAFGSSLYILVSGYIRLFKTAGSGQEET